MNTDGYSAKDLGRELKKRVLLKYSYVTRCLLKTLTQQLVRSVNEVEN